MRILHLVCVMALLTAQSTMAADPAPLSLGVVEAVRDANSPESTPAKTHLRLAFTFDRGTWSATCPSKGHGLSNEECRIDDPARSKTWCVVFKGRQQGTIQTEGWRDTKYYSFVGALAVTKADLPSIREAGEEFPTWGGPATQRPLVALSSSGEGVRPVMWEPVPPAPADSTMSWPLFNRAVPVIPNCRFDDQGKPLGKDRPSTPADMAVFDRVNLGKGGVLLGLRAKSDAECDEYGGFSSDLWVFKPVNGAARLLQGADMTGWGYALRLVDYGYFAPSSDPQAVFAYSGYNEDGYVLYYDGFRKNVWFTWGYH